jgi:hypothetical protein
VRGLSWRQGVAENGAAHGRGADAGALRAANAKETILGAISARVGLRTRPFTCADGWSVILVTAVAYSSPRASVVRAPPHAMRRYLPPSRCRRARGHPGRHPRVRRRCGRVCRHARTAGAHSCSLGESYSLASSSLRRTCSSSRRAAPPPARAPPTESNAHGPCQICAVSAAARRTRASDGAVEVHGLLVNRRDG